MTALEHGEPPTLTAARSYAELGWHVIPILRGEKRPSLSDWTNVATIDPDRIANWWGHGDRYGVGIVTGARSGIWVLDVDVADGKQGMNTLVDLQREHYGDELIPPTVEAITGSGGRHYFFRWDPDHPVGTNGGRLGPGLDVRGEGGQVVAAPTIHPNGTPYRWVPGRSPADIEVAAAPAWLLELLQEKGEPAGTPPDGKRGLDSRLPADSHDDDSPAAWFNAHTTWDQLLTRDGWTLDPHTYRDGERRWTRPGKGPRDGISATVGHGGRDVLKVFTSSVPALEADGAYSRFGYEAAMHHGGDRSELARAVRTSTMSVADVPPMPTHHDDLSWAQASPVPIAPPNGVDAGTGEVVAPDDSLAHLHLVDWAAFWERDPAEQEWCIWPIVPSRRAVALYAPAKAGKSTVLLDAITTVLAGRGWVGGDRPDQPPVVLYLDFEMTEDDLRERLEELGYDAGAPLGHLHYAVLPSLDPLDGPAGATQVVQAAEAVGATLVIIDTFGRAVAGDEDSADTVRAFYRHTGLQLKQRGIALLRTDHTGKDPTKGQRGSSAKADDVDVVWKLSRTDDGAHLERTHSRISWVPATVELVRTDHGDRVGFHARDGAVRGYVPGTKELASLLDDLEVPADASVVVASTALKAAGHGKRKAAVVDAVRFRKTEAKRAADNDLTWVQPVDNHQEPPREPLSDGSDGNRSGTDGNRAAKVQVSDPEPPREPWEPPNVGVPGTAPVTNREPAQGRPAGTDDWKDLL